MSADDVAGWLIGVAVVGMLGFALDTDEIRAKDEAEPIARRATPIVPTPAVPKKPRGFSYIVELENKTVWRLDNDSIKGDDANRLGWVKEDHSNNKDKAARFTSTLYKVNCTTTGYRELALIDYDKDGHGNRPNDSASPKEDRYAPPGSNMAMVIEAMCAPAFELAPTAAPAASPGAASHSAAQT